MFNSSQSILQVLIYRGGSTRSEGRWALLQRKQNRSRGKSSRELQHRALLGDGATAGDGGEWGGEVPEEEVKETREAAERSESPQISSFYN